MKKTKELITHFLDTLKTEQSLSFDLETKIFDFLILKKNDAASKELILDQIDFYKKQLKAITTGKSKIDNWEAFFLYFAVFLGCALNNSWIDDQQYVDTLKTLVNSPLKRLYAPLCLKMSASLINPVWENALEYMD